MLAPHGPCPGRLQFTPTLSCDRALNAPHGYNEVSVPVACAPSGSSSPPQSSLWRWLAPPDCRSPDEFSARTALRSAVGNGSRRHTLRTVDAEKPTVDADDDESASAEFSDTRAQPRVARTAVTAAACALLAACVVVSLNPLRLVVLDAHPLAPVFTGLVALVALGAGRWRTARRWWARRLAALIVVAGVALLPLVWLTAGLLHYGRPIEEITLDSTDGGRVVLQTMSTGLGPDSSCVRLDVRSSTDPFARHRLSACAPQEFQVRARLVSGSRLVLTLDGHVRCEFEIDWSEQRLRLLSAHDRCQRFVR